MNAPADALLHDAARAWPEVNRRWLAARFAWLRVRIERRVAANDDVEALADDERDDGFAPALDRVVGAFGLSPFERELLLLCAGIEIDIALRNAVAQAQGTAAGAPLRVGFALALDALPAAHWDAISPLAPLRRWSLIHFDTSAGLAQAALRIDERVLHHLTGVAAFDARLDGLAHVLDAPLAGRIDEQAADRIAGALLTQAAPLVMLADTTRAAGRELALHALARAGLCALWADVLVWPHDAGEFIDCARRLDREAVLLGAAVVVAADPGDAGDTAAAAAVRVQRLIAAVHSPLLLIGALPSTQGADRLGRRVTRISVAPPGRVRQPAAVAAALEQFRVDACTLDDACATLADPDDADALWAALREAVRGGLDGLAQRIDSRTGFDDLVLPPAALGALREIAGQLRHRHRVHDEWGFAERGPRGLGICALFTGESGTGKTLAAEAIANELRLDLYRIDLALVVSKYIGETEKNLRRVFDAAEASGAVLLFDEADALFGKRSDVKDSHDRYANIEVAYLLQRIEAYRGLAILTTNLKSALDRAFLRRIRFVVAFPFPDEAAREQIWRRQFPPAAPLGELDFAALARINLPGGNIRSIAVNAAFAAAQRESRIEQALLVDAARAEFAKLERGFAAGAGGAA